MNGTVTDIDGVFSLSVEENAVIRISYIGYLSQDIATAGKTTFTIVLEEELQALDELVVVGYGTQKKETLTGSVSAVSSKDIVTTKNENVQNMLTGKIAGVRITQKSSEPGTFNNTFDIRGLGDPLIIIDGIPRENAHMVRLNPEDIESISVLKDASAAVYGVRAANGVVLITTKKGREGLDLEYNGSYTLQYPTGSPESVSAAEWMILANEKSMHNVNGGTLKYTQAEIDEYLNGTKQGTDWYNSLIRKGAPQTQHTVSARGGNEKTQFYASLGYMYQESFLRTNSNNYNRYNLRSNLNSKITDDLTIEIQLSGMMDQSNKTYESTDWIFRSMQRSSAVQPIYANNNPDYFQYGYVDGSNPMAMANTDISGYKRYDNKLFQSSIALEYNVPFLEGLKVKGMIGYDYGMADNKVYKKSYDLYNYDEASDSYNAIPYQSPSTINRSYGYQEWQLYQLSLNYGRLFADKHNVNVFLATESQKREGDGFYAQRELSIEIDQLFAGNSDEQVGSMSSSSIYEHTNAAMIGKMNYDYDSKYLAEFGFRYDGSSKFASGKRWGFFPSVSVGWRISEEPFWKNMNLAFINNAKIRTSYGILGDDSASSYQYLSGYTYPAGGSYNTLPGGYFFDGSFVSASVSTGLANTNITWYTSKTFDAGIDIDAWNGKLGLVVDYFSRRRSGLLATRAAQLSSVVGVSLPQENLDGDLTQGLDMEIIHRGTIGTQFKYQVKGTLGLTRTQYTHLESSGEYGNSYEEWLSKNENRYQSIVWGYEGDSQFTSYEQIANSDVYYDRSTLPGDYIYEDWNGDGIISSLDSHPIAYSGRPRINYGLGISAGWKGFDFDALFQGAGMSYVTYSEILAVPNWGSDYSNSLVMFLDRWHPTDPTADPYDPNTEWTSGHYAYSGTTATSNSTFRYNNTTYLRLKNLEIGYTLPRSIISKTGISNARIYVNGYNLMTWSKMKYIDPEHPNDSYGNVYPLNRTFSIGLNVKF